jgi:hypothetical protein
MALAILRIDTIGHAASSHAMSNNARSPMSRRGLLRMGLFAAACGAAGCGEPTVTQVEKPAAEKGARNRLDKMKEKAEESSGKK